MKHATIIPLIGGLPLGQEKAFGTSLDYILSYEAFKANDQHYVNYRKDVPYILLDQGGSAPHKVDVVGTTCPCAGLSALSTTSSSDSAVNDWMYNSAEYVLEHIQPKVFWGENAPRLATAAGAPVADKLRSIGKKYGYTFSIYKTVSSLHGIGQARDRTFYFFWKGDRIPVFDYYSGEYATIENIIIDAPHDNTLVSKGKPTDDPYYKFILQEIEGGITHQQFAQKIEQTAGVLNYIEKCGIDYLTVGKWMTENGYEKEAEKCQRRYHKLKSGGNIMRRCTTIPKNHIGAFVAHLPHMLTHPVEDRYLTVKECLAIMRMPEDFELLDPKHSINHICQNVPMTTATHMAENIKKYLDGHLDSVDAKYLIQCNKTKKLNIIEQNSIQLDDFMV